MSKILEELQDPRSGASTLFVGSVRNQNLGRVVKSVHYEAFVPLALKTLVLICKNAKKQFSPNKELLKIAIVHRLGKLSVGEMSVAIGVATKHRDESYKISRFIIEELKKQVPIWKKEHYVDGESEWLKGHALCNKNHRRRAHGRSIEQNEVS